MKEKEFVAVGCAVITVSDTRTIETDRSGALIEERLQTLGHHLVRREIIADDFETIQTLVRECISDAAISVVILTGGTGITKRDVTPDAVKPLGNKHIPGFGELFRWLSYADIGASTIQSRTDAWLCGRTLVFVLPGSTGAVTLAMDKILLAQLDSRTMPCNFIQLLDRI